MIGSVFFIFNRLVEIVFLIPIIGMLVCPIVNQSDQQYPSESPANQTSPNTVLLR
jgi:energy-converting hydrogenase Eha subunit F